jgi:hypothetical protein
MMLGVSNPLVLIDFDGVFNIVNLLDEVENGWDDVNEFVVSRKSDGKPNVLLSPSVISFFNRLVDLGVVDIEWLTVWRERTELFPGSIGIANLPWHNSPAHYAANPWWKLIVIQSICASDPDRPILWVDDDLAYARDVAEWLPSAPQVEILSPDTYKGLVREDLDKISAFVARNTGVHIE